MKQFEIPSIDPTDEVLGVGSAFVGDRAAAQVDGGPGLRPATQGDAGAAEQEDPPFVALEATFTVPAEKVVLKADMLSKSTSEACPTFMVKLPLLR